MLSKKDAKVTFLAIYLPTPSPEPLHLSYILFSWGKKTPSYASHVSLWYFDTSSSSFRLLVFTCFFCGNRTPCHASGSSPLEHDFFFSHLVISHCRQRENVFFRDPSSSIVYLPIFLPARRRSS